MRVLQPASWRRPCGYANGMSGDGRVVFVSGQIGWDAEGRIVSDDLAEQIAQALRNIVAVLAEAGAGPEHVARLTWYLTDIDDYMAHQAEVGAAYRKVIGRHFPVMAVVQVVRLVEARALVEIEATAVRPA